MKLTKDYSFLVFNYSDAAWYWEVRCRQQPPPHPRVLATVSSHRVVRGGRGLHLQGSDDRGHAARPGVHRRRPGLRPAGEKDAEFAQKLGQLQPFVAVLPQELHGPTCIFWANLTPFSLQLAAELARRQAEDVQQLEEQRRMRAELEDHIQDILYAETVRALPGQLSGLSVH